MTDRAAGASALERFVSAFALDRAALAGWAIIAITFGGLGGWAALAPLSRAVVSSGTIVVEESRKVIQHLEGGVVGAIAVAEGQQVRRGDVLVRLSPVQAQASVEIVRSQLYTEQALAARLLAEIRQAPEIEFPIELELRSDNGAASAAMRDQEAQFRERAASLALQRRLLEVRIDQLNAEIGGLAADRTSASKQLASINEELVGLRELKSKGLSTLNRLAVVERERIRLEGVLARGLTDNERLSASVEEARVQLSQLRQKFQEETSAALTESRKRLAELSEKLAIAQDVLGRVDIKSPATGTVQGLKVATIGQVIRPAEPLMEIVPTETSLVIHVHLPVHEIEHVSIGQRVEIRFPGFHSKLMPLFEGTLRSISRDRLVEDRNNQPYYLGVVTMDMEGVPDPYRSRLIAGMPADMLIVTGMRTALSYMLSPLKDAFNASFRN
jgi:HlyD family secretion protein